MRMSERIEMRKNSCYVCGKWRFVDDLGICRKCEEEMLKGGYLWSDDEEVDEVDFMGRGFRVFDVDVKGEVV